ncbi:hypothetical protein [Isoptericola dokdonensis]|uniref:Uncharacterized protein n=1 Tax=Isoptericola dokdonensis DS-3 TaxID=1300344 RepID=A0A168EAX0_9MICO|nr:hypothetical protein [Isoptericola dokdonensis]ANC29818.1 hypothetical protein I598_0227 [Isoptericola dokdonensis DS-3]
MPSPEPEPFTVEGTYTGKVTVTEDWSNEDTATEDWSNEDTATRLGQTFEVRVEVPASCVPVPEGSCEVKYSDLYERSDWELDSSEFTWAQDGDRWVLTSRGKVTDECLGGGTTESSDDITFTFKRDERAAKSVRISYVWNTTDNPSNQCAAGFHTDGRLTRR